MSRRAEDIANQNYYEPDTKEIGFRMAYVLYEAGGQLGVQRLADVLADHFQISVLWEYDDTNEILLIEKWNRAIRRAVLKMSEWGFVKRTTPTGEGYPILTKSGQELGSWAHKFYEQEDIDLPEWTKRLLRPLEKRIDRFLKGGKF